MPAFSDKTMTCKDCGAEFVWTAGEQEFYQQKGFQYPPARCPKCRDAKKQQVQAGYDITCAKCGQPAKVKFQPRGDRPVYCFDCYKANQGGEQPPAQEPAQGPAEVPVEVPAEAPVEVPIEAPAEKSAEEPAEAPAKKTAKS